jgi:polysaccharide export outer membrane protein
MITLGALFCAGPLRAQEDGYQIGPEDVLRVAVWKEADLQLEALVRPDGAFTLPLIGDVHAAGRTTAAITEEITHRLGQYIANPVVTVAVVKVGGNKIYVIGKVNKPGEFAAGRYVDVMQALTMAGGLNPFAASGSIKVLRRKSPGATSAIAFDYDAVAAGKELEQNIVLQDGDVVVVP